MSITQMQAIYTRLEELERRVAELEQRPLAQPQIYTAPEPYQVERRGPGRPKGSRNGF